MALADTLAAIWEESRDEVLLQVGAVCDAVADALAGELTAARREAAAKEAHKLAGSVGSFGFSAASQHACELEHALRKPDELVGDELPRLAEHAVALRKALLADPAPSSSSPVDPQDAAEPSSILLIGDDRERLAELLRETEARGHPAATAADLPHARQATARVAPEVVVLDLGPGDGGEEMQFLAETAADRPVMILADPDRIDRVEVARLGGRTVLPRSSDAASVLAAALDLLERARVTGSRALLVDDDPAVLAALRSVLEDAGVSVSTCEGIGDFLHRLEQVGPDIIVLNFEMPGASGAQLCHALRNEPRWGGVPVMFMTSRTDQDTVRVLFESGADDYLAKPFVGPEVVARIKNRLERVRLQRAAAERDSLTGLLNRQAAVTAMERHRGLAARHEQPWAVAVLDIDSLRSINADHGQQHGDDVLRELAQQLRQTFRGEDVLVRWGGDELLVAMYAMSATDAERRLRDFREHLAAGPLAGGIHITLSIGIAEYPGNGTSVSELTVAAEAAARRAQVEGGDRIVFAGGRP